MKEADRGISCDVEGGMATIRLTRERGNAINSEMIEVLQAAFARAEADPGVRGVLLATGRSIFCPGLDLPELQGYDRPGLDRFMTRFSTCVRALYEFPKPVVAALSGHAVAGGCVLALTADWRVLKAGATIGLNEVRIGVPLPYGVSLMVLGAVPPHRVTEVALLGLNFGGDEAVSTGLVHEVHEADGFEDHCRERLAELASRETGAYAVTKRYLRSDAIEKMRAADAIYLDEWLDRWFSPEAQDRVEGVVAGLRARRTP